MRPILYPNSSLVKGTGSGSNPPMVVCTATGSRTVGTRKVTGEDGVVMPSEDATTNPAVTRGLRGWQTIFRVSTMPCMVTTPVAFQPHSAMATSNVA